MYSNLSTTIEDLWSAKEPVPGALDAIEKVLHLLTVGQLRVCESAQGAWVVNQWVKKAILLYFKYKQSMVIEGSGCNFYDKVPLLTHNWQAKDFAQAQFRLVPGAQVRYGAYLGKNVVVMPSFVNMGAFVGDRTMIDSGVTVGSCAQIGQDCHISSNVVIGGVLEPLQANPVIVEDNVFIGAGSAVVEGVHVGKGAVLSMGVHLSSSTKIYDRQTGEVTYGYVPEYAVIVPGTVPSSDGKTQLYAAIIIKKVDAKTRSKVQINYLLRDEGDV